MATIRDVVDALSRRAGVDAVVVVGRDGLPIDSRTGNGVDAENVAAHVPAVIDRKSTRLNSSHLVISSAVFCLQKKNFNIVGYTAADVDAMLCQYALRRSILAVSPPESYRTLRIEFIGDAVESIRKFESTNQRS